MRPFRLFSNAKAGKYAVEELLDIDLTGQPAKAVSRPPVFLGRQFRRRSKIEFIRRAQRLHSTGQRMAMPGARDDALRFWTVRRHHHPTQQVQNMFKITTIFIAFQ